TYTGAGGGTWTAASSWSNNSPPGNYTTATFNSTGGGNNNVDLGGPVTIVRMIFSGIPSAYTFAAGNTLTFNPGGGITITNTVTTIQTLNCDIALQRPAIFANGATSGGFLIINGGISGASAGLDRLSLIYNGGGLLNGVISDGSGTVGLFKAGTGTWTLSKANTF